MACHPNAGTCAADWLVTQVKLIAKAWKFQATKTPVDNDPHFRQRAGAA